MKTSGNNILQSSIFGKAVNKGNALSEQLTDTDSGLKMKQYYLIFKREHIGIIISVVSNIVQLKTSRFFLHKTRLSLQCETLY